MATLRAIQNHIIFQFEERAKVQDGVTQFVEERESGLEVVRHKDSVDSGRWGYIVSVGPRAAEEGFEPGQRVFIEPLKWTNAVKFEGEEYWRTDAEQILCVDDNPPARRNWQREDIAYPH